MKLKKYKKKKMGTYFTMQIVIILCALVVSMVSVNSFSRRYNDRLLPVALAEARKYMTVVINDATKGVKFDKNLFTVQKENDEIKMINYNSYEATKLINEITNNIQDRLNKNDEYYNSMIGEIPLGLIFNNSLFSNFGPRIKVRIDMVGNVISQLETEVKPYGINNALVEVRVRIEGNVRVVLPLTSKEITINNMIPISINIINGKIPEGYFMTYK